MQRDSGGLSRPGFCRDSSGYTIVEVMIVLAIGTIMFVAAVSLFAGKQGRAEFSQTMRDVASQIQSVINDVSVSNFPDASSYSCSIIGSRPQLSSGASPTGTNTECIFLGKAIMLDRDGSAPHEMRVYTVLGRTKDGSNQTVTSFSGANPTPIMGPPSAKDLTISYPISFSATVLSARVDAGAPSGETDLVGFYNSLQPSGSAPQGSQSLLSLGYVGFDSTNPSARAQISQTIRGQIPLYPPTNVKTWTICLASGTSNETAELVVSSSLSGVTTNINYTSCS